MAAMRSHLMSLTVAGAITLTVGLLSAVGWPGYVIGAALALSLWVMLFFSPSPSSQHGAVAAKTYAGAAVLAVALGYLFFLLGDRNAGAWAPAFIVAGVISFASPTRSDRASGATSARR